MIITEILAFLIQPNVLYAILAFIFGGGLVTMIKTYNDSRATNATLAHSKLKIPLEVESLQIAGMEALVKNLQADNDVLREDRAYWKENYEMVREQVTKLSDELERQEERNTRLRKEVEALKRKLDDAELNSPAALSERRGVREHEDKSYADDQDFDGRVFPNT